MGNINDSGFPFTSVAGDRQYSAEEWREYFAAFTTGGVVTGLGTELEVKPQASPNKTVYVDTGAALLQGAIRIMAGTTNLTIADNSSGNPRIDRIVAKLNYADRKIELIVKQGTPAASPAAPTLTRDATAYEISLAKVAAANGFTTITASEITDERADTTVCGAANFTLGILGPKADAIILSTAAQALLGVTNVDDALKNGLNNASYMAFCGNVNATMLDAAFGKLNESYVGGLGRQLAMYAWFKGESKVTYPYTQLLTKNTLDECFQPDSLAEILLSTNLLNLILASPHATAEYNAITSAALGKAIASMVGLNPDDYADLTAVATSATAMTAVAASSAAMGVVTTNTQCMDAICLSGVALNKIVKSTTAKTALLTNITAAGWYTRSATIKTTLDAGTAYFTATNVDGTMSIGSGGSTDYIGGATSFGYVNVLTDADGGTPNFTDVKHQHNSLSFGFSIGADVSTTVQRFGVGGAIITSSGDSGTLTYTATNYTAI